MDFHLLDDKLENKENRHNGHTHKVVKSCVGLIEVNTPRDRDCSHEPKLIVKWEREIGTGLDDVILSLYARGYSAQILTAL